MFFCLILLLKNPDFLCIWVLDPISHLTELKGVNWDELQQYDQVNDCCNKLMSTIGSIVDKYIKKRNKSHAEKISDTLDEWYN